MPINEAIDELIGATTLGGLQLCFRQFCAHFGAVKSTQVLLVGQFGSFCAFCTAEFAAPDAGEPLLRGYGFKEIGAHVYLPLALAADFDRRAAVRAA